MPEIPQKKTEDEPIPEGPENTEAKSTFGD
jgi:hypothetical protein